MTALINRLASFSLVLVLITTGYGCTDLFLPDKGNQGQPCLDNGECKPGLVCQDNKCVEGSTDGGQTCQADAECDDENACTADSCVEGNCVNENLQNGSTCDDDNTCTQDDACTDGVCAGTDKDCSLLDGLCKRGVCFSENGQCVQISADDGDGCDDGLYCTTGDQCLSGDCVGTDLDCDDSDVCTTDTCDDIGDACQNVLDPAQGTIEGPVGDVSCSNGVDDDCDGQTDLDDSECVACSSDGDCDDNNACTTDTCDTGQCTYQDATNGTSCDDTFYCTENDECLAGVCTGSSMDCSHLSDACNDGVCSEAATGCTAQPKANGTACDDGLYCTVPDQCSNGVCQLDALDCDDADSCTADACDENNDRCTNTLVPNPGAEGPQGDATCSNNIDDDCDGQTDLDDSDCVDCQSANDCDDANPCTLDDCQAGGCTNTPQVGQGCDDSDPCTHTDECLGDGSCQGTAIACVDGPAPCGVVRTCNGTDTCDESYPTVACDDTDPCTHSDSCDGAGSCAGTFITCQDDPAVCGVKRSCNGTATCDETYPGVETSCDDSNLCTYNDACEGTGVCVGTAIQCTGDPGPCGVIRTCDGTDTCIETFPGSSTSCDDGLFCTDGDSCFGDGTCAPGAGTPCNAGWTCWEDEDVCCADNASLGCGGPDNDVYWFDSCGHELGRYEDCPDPNGECVSGTCRCRNHWSGQDCLFCPDDWTGQDCDICVRYVDVSHSGSGSGLSWSDAFSEVQPALDAAYQETVAAGGPDVCEVWVAVGTYYIYSTARTDTVQLHPGVELYGGFDITMTQRDQRDWEANLTVLNGWDDPTHNSQVTNVVTGADKSTIDGFLIYGGEAGSGVGGGMLNDVVSPVVANCVFLENGASSGGGMANLNNSPVIRDCHFTDNNATWGGAMYNSEASPFIRRCIFAGNVASNGGGVRSQNGGGYINNSLFVGNRVLQTAASLWVSGETVANCTFYGNAPGGSVNSIAVAGNPDFRNCILWDTWATHQVTDLGGADVRYTDVFVTSGAPPSGPGNITANCGFPIVIQGLTWNGRSYSTSTYQTKLSVQPRNWNLGEFKGMALRPNMANPRWYIILDNDENQIFVWGDLTNDVPVGAQFQIVDLELVDRSPCVDHGDVCAAPTTDLYYRSRLQDDNSPNDGVGPPWVDMGALERQAGSSSLPSDLLTMCCGNGYTYSNHEYHICTDQVPWATAAFRCLQYGAYLATIGDAAENAFVNSVITANIWLGANDIWEEGAFWWVTNEPWLYDNWDNLQPDNTNNEDCLEMQSPSSRWLDTSCEYPRSFVCEKPN